MSRPRWKHEDDETPRLRPGRGMPSGRYRCPKCGAAEVYKLPEDGISPHPGYTCGECGVRMSAGGMRVAYGVVTLIAGAIFCATVALLVGGHVGVVRAAISLAVVSVALA